jgi:hypothetical protein
MNFTLMPGSHKTSDVSSSCGCLKTKRKKKMKSKRKKAQKKKSEKKNSKKKLKSEKKYQEERTDKRLTAWIKKANIRRQRSLWQVPLSLSIHQVTTLAIKKDEEKDYSS